MSWFSKLLGRKSSSFFEAVRAGDTHLVQEYLTAGIDPNRPVEAGPRYPLQYAVHAGQKMVALLLKHGADVNCRDKLGQTPLHIAAACGRIEVVQFLLDSGADPNATNNEDDTPLDNTYQSDFLVELLALSGTPTPPESISKERAKKAIRELIEGRGGRSGHAMEPSIRGKIKSRIPPLVTMARINFPTLDINAIVEKVQSKIDLTFPANMPPSQQDQVRKEVREMILKKCREAHSASAV